MPSRWAWSVSRMARALTRSSRSGRRGRPRQLHHPLEIAAHDLRLGAVRVHALEALELAHRFGLGLGREPRVAQLGAILLDLLEARIDLAELRLDRAHLFAQELLAMAARDLFLRLRLDLGLHRGDFEFAPQQRVDAAQPRERILDLEDLLRVFETQLQIRRDQVGEAAGLLHVRGDRKHLGRQVLQRQQLFHARSHRAHHGLDLHRPGRFGVRGQRLDGAPRALPRDRRSPRSRRAQDPAPAPSRGRRADASSASPSRPCRGGRGRWLRDPRSRGRSARSAGRSARRQERPPRPGSCDPARGRGESPCRGTPRTAAAE